MRLRQILAVVTLALVGCSERHADFDLKQLNQVLNDALPRTTYGLSLTLTQTVQDGTDVIHCVLTNTAAEPITLDSSTLPWATPSYFMVNAVTAGGKVIRYNPPFSVLMNEAGPVTIAGGQSLAGEFETRYLPFQSLPRGQDLLLLWSYVVAIEGTPQYFLSGTTMLTRREVP